MAQLFFNNARGRLSTPLEADTTEAEITLSVGFPASLRLGDWFLMTIFADSRQYGENHEVVKVTSIQGDTFTLVRGVEGQAVPHVVGEIVEIRTTAGILATAEKTRRQMKMQSLGISAL